MARSPDAMCSSEYAAPPSWAARILCSFYSGICANCADRKNFLETIRFFAENRSSPENLGAVFQSATLTRCGIHGRQSWAKVGDSVTARQKRIPNPAPLRSFHPHSKTPISKPTNSLTFSAVRDCSSLVPDLQAAQSQSPLSLIVPFAVLLSLPSNSSFPIPSCRQNQRITCEPTCYSQSSDREPLSFPLFCCPQSP